MSDIPEDILAVVTRMPADTRFAQFLLHLQLAILGHGKRHQMMEYVLAGSSLPEEAPSEKKREGQFARAIFLSLPEAQQAELRSVTRPVRSVGGKRSRKARKARKAQRESTRRRRAH